MATFTLTSAQQQQLKTMSPDRADAQIAVWRKQWEAAQVNPYDTSRTGTTVGTTGGTTGGGGGGSVTVTAPATTTTTTPYANWEDAAKELYGGYFAIVQSVPELRSLLEQAYNQKWSRERFEYELRQTSWWKTNADSARQWDLQSQMDPASAAQRVESRFAELKALAMDQYGVAIADSVLRRLATDSLRLGWSQQLITNAIGIEVLRTPGGLSQLAAGFLGQSLRTTAKEYGVPLSDSVSNDWITQIASGNQTRQTFQTYIVDSAKRLYPSIAKDIDAGSTFQQIVDPYRNVAAQILEINPETVDFLDPKWTKAVTYGADQGQQRTMTYSEWGDYLRQDRSFGYEFTSQAQARAYQVANDLANLFGKV